MQTAMIMGLSYANQLLPATGHAAAEVPVTAVAGAARRRDGAPSTGPPVQALKRLLLGPGADYLDQRLR